MASVKVDIIKKLEEIYLMTGYLDRYGTDLWISFTLCIIFILLILFYHYSNRLEVVKANWENEKNNPFYMPFAGYINKPTDKSYSEFASENFMNSIHSVLEGVSVVAISPFRTVLNILNKAVKDLLDSFDMLRGLINNIRRAFSPLFDAIYSVVLNIVVDLIKFIINLRDMINKMSGILTTALYVAIGAFMTLQAMFKALAKFLILILFLIAAMIIAFIAIATGLIGIPLIGQAIAAPIIAVAFVTTLVMIVIMVLVIIFEIFVMRILNLSAPPLPGIPSCFSETTRIPLFESDECKYIKDIKIGDRLKNGGLVTATMQFSAKGQNIYKLNGVYVTGEHRIFHSTLKWIKVKNHPDCLYIPTFNEPYVYCINTDKKEFIIGDTLFSDWDDIDHTVLHDLQVNCVKTGYLPDNFTLADIHTYLDSGLHPTTKITLENGLQLPIQEVNVNDILYNNTRVLGVIKIAGHDIKQYKHFFGADAFISASKNIHIADTNLGIIECMKRDSMQSSEIEPVLYHLLTDTKFFIANNITINDYNFGIDAYLRS